MKIEKLGIMLNDVPLNWVRNILAGFETRQIINLNPLLNFLFILK